MSQHRIQRMSVEGLRTSPAATLPVLVSDVIRQHVDRIDPSCIADLFALAELPLGGALAADLGAWATRAEREIADLPDGTARAAFVAELAALPPGRVPARLRAVVEALAGRSQPSVSERVAAVRELWARTPPDPVILPTPRAPSGRAAAAAAERRSATPERKTASPTRPPRAPRTPAHLVDPRRGEWVREDAVARLKAPEYLERGLKESILVAGIKHRSPYKDLTTEEVMSELRRLERERRLKHTGERWLAR